MLPDGAIALEPNTRMRVREQLVADCEFMRRMKIMDYSLLIGVHHIPPKGRSVNANQDVGTTGFRFTDMRKDSFTLRDIVRSTVKENGSSKNLSDPSLQHDLDAALEPTNSSSLGLGILKLASSSQSAFSRDNELLNDESKDSEKHFAPLAMYEHGLDDDDDNSYLEGSPENPSKPTSADEQQESMLEQKKEETIEKVYWPFHSLHDINGDRRAVPASKLVSKSNDALQNMELDCTCGRIDGDQLVIGGAKLPAFTPPLSSRKDGGLMMDTTGLEKPIMFKSSTGKEHICEGKIYYMGIIDILQQFNTRKRIETGYHRVEGSGWQDHSCVHPDVYAERFIKFFDEYSQRDYGKKDNMDDNVGKNIEDKVVA